MGALALAGLTLSRTQCLKKYAVSLQSRYDAAADVLRPCLKILTRSFVNHIRQSFRSAKLHDLGFLIHAGARFPTSCLSCA